MSVEIALYQRMAAVIGGSVGTRIYPDEAAQGCATPYVVYTLAGGQEPVTAMGRPRIIDRDRIQIDFYDATPEGAAAGLEALIDGLAGASADAAGGGAELVYCAYLGRNGAPAPERDPKLYRRSGDFRVHSRKG